MSEFDTSRRGPGYLSVDANPGPGDPDVWVPTGKANGRMHHHDKHAATKDGHRPDDPHAVTGWKQQEMDALIQRQSEIQSVLDEPNIQREGHEVFDENVNYGQRVSAFGNVERNLADQQIESRSSRPRPDSWSGTRPVYEPSEGYDIEGDEAVDVIEGEEDQAFAKKAMYGQDYGYSKERRQHEAQTGTSLGSLARPRAGDKEWEQTVARGR